MPKKKTYDQAFGRLEEIIEQIDGEEIPLDKSLELYKEAVDLTVFCADFLNKAEQDVAVLVRNALGAIEVRRE